ncbi:MAG: hypothetical protein JWR26_3205 [Pedosphaera sp.]|nr:hypothetical protein [Pedosphaera sp.]
MKNTTRKIMAGAALTLAVLVMLLVILASKAPSAYTTDQPKAVRINCMSNLKQIGLAFRVWEGDHQDQYTFNVSMNQGGSLEFCDRDANGFERSSWRHFLPMKDELVSPMVLACPMDKSKVATRDWQALGPGNVTYLIRSGTNIDETNPNEVMVVCPICGNRCYTDGHVEGPKKDK